MQKKLKATRTSTLSTIANTIKFAKMESHYDKILKTEGDHHSWCKSPIVRVIVEVLAGCILFCCTGTSFICLFKYVRNNTRCKVC